jgi:thiaminase/transcriptional activator TenA
MSNFHQQLLKQTEEVWEKMLGHRFLKMTADRSIPADTFKIWMRQDYIFVREAIPFTAVLLSKAPVELRPNLTQVLPALDNELKLFRKNAEAHGVTLDNVQPSPTCHAYLQFLMATAFGRSFEEGFTVLYAAEKAYFDSWMAVKKNLEGESPWQSFIENWTSPGFQQYVEWLATTLDELAKGQPRAAVDRIRELFQMTARYEYLFWEMAATGEDWPV